MLSVRDTCRLDSRSVAAVSGGFPRSAWLSQASAAGSLKRGSVLASKRVIAQIRVPDRVSTMSPTVWSSPVCGSRAAVIVPASLGLLFPAFRPSAFPCGRDLGGPRQGHGDGPIAQQDGHTIGGRPRPTG